MIATAYSIPGVRPRRSLAELVDRAFREPIVHAWTKWKSGHLLWTPSHHLATTCSSNNVYRARYCPVVGAYTSIGALASNVPSRPLYVNLGSGQGCIYFPAGEAAVSGSGLTIINPADYSTVSSCAATGCPPLVCGCQSGFTPTTATVTFSGLNYGAACFHTSEGWWSNAKPLGTYSFSITSCAGTWGNFSETSTDYIYVLNTDGTCTTTTTGRSDTGVFLTYNGSNQWTLKASHYAAGGGTYFNGTAIITDCKSPVVFTNSYTTPDPTGVGNFAAGGTATLTFS